MATLDPSRTALELSEDELSVGARLLAAPGHASLSQPSAVAAIRGLEQAGALENGQPSGYPADLLALVAAPKLRVIVEKFVVERTVIDYAWATERQAVWGEGKGEDAVELTPVEPGLIPWAIARSVGLGPRPRPRLDRPLTLRASALDEAFNRLFAEGSDAAEEALARTQLTADERQAFLELLLGRRLSWRASSCPAEPGSLEEELAWVAVIDGGEGGLWLSEHGGSEHDPTVTLEPISPGAAWERIVELMPAPNPSH